MPGKEAEAKRTLPKRKAEGGRRKAEGGRWKREEGRGKREEGRGKRESERRNTKDGKRAKSQRLESPTAGKAERAWTESREAKSVCGLEPKNE